LISASSPAINAFSRAPRCHSSRQSMTSPSCSPERRDGRLLSVTGTRWSVTRSWKRQGRSAGQYVDALGSGRRRAHLRLVPRPNLVGSVHARNLRRSHYPVGLLGELGPVRVDLAAQDRPSRLAVLEYVGQGQRKYRREMRACSRHTACCERPSWHLTSMPVGMCVRRTADSVLLTCYSRSRWSSGG
jgi:hypothetical protein